MSSCQHFVRRGLKILTDAQLHKLTTPRLLAYFRRLNKVHENYDWDLEPYMPRPLVKANPEWVALRARVKAVLDTRPHVPSPRP